MTLKVSTATGTAISCIASSIATAMLLVSPPKNADVVFFLPRYFRALSAERREILHDDQQ